MKWNGKNYRPLVPQKIKFQEEKFDVEEYLKSLAEKHDRIPVWRSVIGVNVPVEEGPQPTPSITPSVTPSITPSPTPSITPSPTFTPTSSLTPTPTPSSIASGTTEALAYLETVVQSGGTVSAPQSAATISFFTSLVSNNLWDKVYAFYPLLGGNSSTAQAVEGKLNYPIQSWGGGFTFSNDGVQGNGVNNYAEVGVSPNVIFGGNGQPSSLGVFVNLEGTVGNRVYDMGVNEPVLENQSNIAVRRVTGGVNECLFDAGDYNAFTTASGRVSTTVGSSSGMTIGTARSASDKELYRNGLSIATKTITGNLEYSTLNYLFTAQNENNVANWFNSNRYGFMFIGSGLTDNEVLTLSTLVNEYQDDLGRYSYIPSGITEANEFLNRVVTSGGTVDSTTSAATQTLFTSIVNEGLWEKLDVFYPIIGGNAQGNMQGAGSRYTNLNNLTFNGGWTHSLSGMTPNGVNGYANTQYSPQNTSKGGVNVQTCSLGGYVNTTGYNGAVLGAIDPDIDIYQVRLNTGSNTVDGQPNTTLAGAVSTTLSATTGLYLVSRTGSTETFVLQNTGVTVLSQAQATFNTGTDVYVGARNYAGIDSYGDGRISFVFMGRSLTVPEAQTLRTIIQTFQTTLSRNSI